MDTTNLIKALRQRHGLTQQELADRAGVVRPVIARAEKSRRGLSTEAAEQLGEVLETDPTALFIISNVAAKAAQVDAGEITAGDALASLSRVAVKVQELHQAGELTASREMTQAAELLARAIRELSQETESVAKSLGTTVEEIYDDPSHLAQEGRDSQGLRAPEGSIRLSDEGSFPLAPWHATAPPHLDRGDYDDFVSEGRDHNGIRITALDGDDEDDDYDEWDDEDYDAWDEGRDENGIRIRPLNER